MQRTFPLKNTEAAEKYISFLLSQGYEFHVKCFASGRVDVSPIPAKGRELPEADFPSDRYLVQESKPLPFASGPGSASVYNSAFQCSSRCSGTQENPCTVAMNRSQGARTQEATCSN